MKAPPEPFRCIAEGDSGMVRLVMIGEFDESAIDVFLTAFETHAEAAEIVVLDLERVAFIDSSGLRALLRTRADIEKRGGRLFLGGVSPAVERVLAVTKLHRYMEGGLPTPDRRRRGGLRRRPWA